MKYQEKKKKNINLLSVESAQKVVKVKLYFSVTELKYYIILYYIILYYIILYYISFQLCYYRMVMYIVLAVTSMAS